MKYLTLFFLFLIPLLINNKSIAGQITKIDGKKIFFQMSPKEHPKVGDIIHILDLRSNQIGFFKVTNIKGNRGLGELKKGHPLIGYKVVINQERKIASSEVNKFTINSKSSIGLLAGMSSQKLSLKNNGEVVAFSGTNPSLSFFYQRALNPNLKVSFLGEYLIFSVNSSIGEESVNIKVNYLALEGRANYYLSSNLWIGFGFAYLSPLSKSAYEGYSLDNISSANTMTFNLGYDFKLKKKGFIPVSLTYGMFAGGESASLMGVKAGYGWYF